MLVLLLQVAELRNYSLLALCVGLQLLYQSVIVVFHFLEILEKFG